MSTPYRRVQGPSSDELRTSSRCSTSQTACSIPSYSTFRNTQRYGQNPSALTSRESSRTGAYPVSSSRAYAARRARQDSIPINPRLLAEDAARYQSAARSSTARLTSTRPEYRGCSRRASPERPRFSNPFQTDTDRSNSIYGSRTTTSPRLYSTSRRDAISAADSRTTRGNSLFRGSAVSGISRTSTDANADLAFLDSHAPTNRSTSASLLRDSRASSSSLYTPAPQSSTVKDSVLWRDWIHDDCL